MPHYDYLCEACGHTFELYQSFHDEPASTCTKCGGPVRRVFAPAPIIFKGSGWYVTDSKRPSAGLSAAKDKSSKAATKGDVPAGETESGGKGDDGAGKGDEAAGKKDAGGKDDASTSPSDVQ